MHSDVKEVNGYTSFFENMIMNQELGACIGEKISSVAILQDLLQGTWGSRLQTFTHACSFCSVYEKTKASNGK